MKKFIIIALAAAFAAAACEKTPTRDLPVQVSVSLTYENGPFATEGITVSLADLNGSASYQAQTDASGTALFSVLPGIYSAQRYFQCYRASIRHRRHILSAKARTFLSTTESIQM